MVPVTEQPVRYEVVDGVAWLTINRPETRNARNKAVRDGRTGAGHITAPPDTAKAAVLQTIVADLAAETDSLVTILARLATADWDALTPAEGWTIRDQVTHLAFFDDATLLAVNDPAAFAAQRAELLALGAGFPDVVAAHYRHLAGEQCLAWLSRSWGAPLAAYHGVDPDTRLPGHHPATQPGRHGSAGDRAGRGRVDDDRAGLRRRPDRRPPAGPVRAAARGRPALTALRGRSRHVDLPTAWLAGAGS
jgi:uncharacterized protein (TIGR03083 family)